MGIQRSLCLRVLCRVSPPDSIPLPPSELWVNRPPLGVPPPRAYCRSCINSRLAVYHMDPYCTISLVYMSSKSSLLCVSIGAVFVSEGLGYRGRCYDYDAPLRRISLCFPRVDYGRQRPFCRPGSAPDVYRYHTRGRCKWVSLLTDSIQPSTPLEHRSPCGVVIFGALMADSKSNR